jgi:pentatricopeptide repeat protein
MELFAHEGFEDEAWALVDDMKAQGIMPDIETYKFLLQVRTTSSLFGGATETLFWHRLFVSRLTKLLGPCSE